MLEFTVGDTAPTLAGTVSANLTGASARVHVVRPDGTIIDRAATIPAGTGGAWSLPLVSGDLTAPGRYRVEVQVTFSSGEVQTFAEDVDHMTVAFNARQQIA